jgi:hypothetical protein
MSLNPKPSTARILTVSFVPRRLVVSVGLRGLLMYLFADDKKVAVLSCVRGEAVLPACILGLTEQRIPAGIPYAAGRLASVSQPKYRGIDRSVLSGIDHIQAHRDCGERTRPSAAYISTKCGNEHQTMMIPQPPCYDQWQGGFPHHNHCSNRLIFKARFQPQHERFSPPTDC